MSATTVADVLRQARALIDTPEKWSQGGSTDDSRFCVLEALGAATGISRTVGPLSTVAWDRGREALYGAIEPRPEGLSIWNDADERTHADVLAAFDRAITAAEASPEGVST